MEVKAARIVHKTDGLLLYPSDAQKEASSSGYSVLQKLSLPNIRIDEDARNVSTIDNKGSVQLRINGIIVDQAEMLSLDPKSIRKIDFIDNPVSVMVMVSLMLSILRHGAQPVDTQSVHP